MVLGVDVNVNQLADQLAKIAGPIAQHGWEVYVRQQYVIGIQQLVTALVLFVVFGLSVLMIRYAIRDKNQIQSEHNVKEAEKRKSDCYYIPSGFDSTGHTCAIAIIGIFAVAVFFVALGLVVDGFGHLANPEYGAIQSILGR